MIELTSVSRWFPTRFGRKHVLRDVSFTIPAGRNVGVVGRNGAGKSTLIRLIAGTDRPDRGRVRIEGSVSWPLGLSGGVQGSMTGRENTRFVCWVHGLDGATVRRVEDFTAGFSELGRDFDLPVKTYSSGMRARLTFAISMAFDFDWYLLDEVGAPGDARFKAKSEAALRAKKGRANYVLVSQNVRALADEVDIILVVDDGAVTMYDPPQAAVAPFLALMQAA